MKFSEWVQIIWCSIDQNMFFLNNLSIFESLLLRFCYLNKIDWKQISTEGIVGKSNEIKIKIKWFFCYFQLSIEHMTKLELNWKSEIHFQGMFFEIFLWKNVNTFRIGNFVIWFLKYFNFTDLDLGTTMYEWVIALLFWSILFFFRQNCWFQLNSNFSSYYITRQLHHHFEKTIFWPSFTYFMDKGKSENNQ